MFLRALCFPWGSEALQGAAGLVFSGCWSGPGVQSQGWGSSSSSQKQGCKNSTKVGSEWLHTNFGCEEPHRGCRWGWGVAGFGWLSWTMRADIRAAHESAAGIHLAWPPEAGAKMSGKCSRKKIPHKQRRIWAIRGKKREWCGPNSYHSVKSMGELY